jgi:nucleoside-diphosphate-sugar epimerase
MKVLINLARGQTSTRNVAISSEIELSERLARAAVEANVGLLIHTGTVASYDLSDPDVVVTECTSFGPLERRNVYASAKAEGEARITAICAEAGLPLVIARPGIVVGREQGVQHWGIGRWYGPRAVRLWNAGRNVLPFVLVDDVVDALIRMTRSEAALGQSFNLVGEPMLTAREYLDEVATRLGLQIHVAGGSPILMWGKEKIKVALKRHVLHDELACDASLADWRSRGHLARFDNTKPKVLLGWKPESDCETFLRRAIDRAGLL